MKKDLNPDFISDIETVQKISVVPSILKVICSSTGMRFAVVARVTKERWIACAVQDEISFGLTPGGELEIGTTICNEIIQSGTPVAIDNVSEDEIYRYHHTPKLYGLESYISVPITLKDGSFFGTLCAIDPAPANVKNSQIVDMFELYAELIGMHITAVREQELNKKMLDEERRTSIFRDKFIAILGHDLNNPLNAVMLSAQAIKTIATDEMVIHLADVINSSSKRMNDLIEDVLDFAKGQLGDGIQATLLPRNNIEIGLQQIVSEFLVIHPNRLIEVDIKVGREIYCDDKRIFQLFSNLLSNAYKYGHANCSIMVKASVQDDEFLLSVSNACEKIPEANLERLFLPFYHGLKTGSKGLGLGLYISKEIAKAHGASLEVSSTEIITTFTLRLPLQ